MQKLLIKTLLAGLIFSFTGLNAQTRVFKEVGSEIKTQVNSIRQDNQLVGYLAFTQLEKASADSFNYRITIMDENLNDVGIVNFKELNLKLRSVSFESNIICLAYTRSPLALEDPKLKRDDYELIEQKKKKEIGVFFQFLTLEGKIANTLMIPESIASFESTKIYGKKGIATTGLVKGLQMQNVSGKGFAIFYGAGDKMNNQLLFVKTDGAKVWQKKLPNFYRYTLQVATTGIHLLGEPTTKVQIGGEPDTRESNEILTYAIETGEAYKSIKLKDPKQNDLYLISIRTNAETGRLNVLGMVVNPEREYYPSTLKSYTKKKPFSGFFSMDFTVLEKKEIKTTYSFFGDSKNTQFFDKKGRLSGQNNYLVYNNAFIDAEGQTYFSATKFEKKVRIGSIIFTVVTIPLYLPPVLIAIGGYNKYIENDGQVVVLKNDGSIAMNKPIASDKGKRLGAKTYLYSNKDFQYARGLSGEDYYLMSDPTKLSIYNVKLDKVVRTIPLKEGKESLNIFPAKEGYFMVQEYNSKEKSTSLSIEAL